MKKLIWVLIVLLIVLHHDFWFWEDKTLVFGFLPVGLLYHIGLSIAAAATWLLAATFAWPEASPPPSTATSPSTATPPSTGAPPSSGAHSSSGHSPLGGT